MMRLNEHGWSQRGASLVELMVALVLGLLIIAALVALFMGTSRNNRQMATANSLIENGRFAIQLLENDLVHAGYWGTHVPRFDDPTFVDVPADEPGAVPDPCRDYDLVPWDDVYINSLIGIPVQAYDAAAVCGGVVTDMVAGSDMLIVRHAETCAEGVDDCEAAVPDKLYIQSDLCTSEVPPAPPYVFGAEGTAVFNLTRMNCVDAAEKRKFTSHIYYVRDHAVTAGDDIPTLVRAEFELSGGTVAHQPPVALIEGIDTMRVEFGVDDLSRTGDPVDYDAAIAWADPDTKTAAVNRGDGIPDDDFVRCTTAVPCTLDELTNTTAVRVYVLARSREATVGYTDTKTYTLGAAGAVAAFNDGFKRHVYSTTVRLINVSGRRERP